MSKWGKGTITNKGLDLITRSQLGERVLLTRFTLGEGNLGSVDPATLEGLVQPVLSKAILTKEQLAFRALEVRTDIRPEDVPRDFWWREVGVYAQGEDGAEVLYLYNYAGDQADLVSKDNMKVLILKTPLYVGNAQTITASLDGSGIYVPLPELLEEIKKVGGAGSGLDADTVDGKHAAAFATAAHVHTATDITSGIVPILRGGTGLGAAPSMLTNLASTAAASPLQASPRPGVTGILGPGGGGTGQNSLQATRNAMGLGNTLGAVPIVNGGTGATTAEGARANLGLGPPAIYQTLIGLRWGGLGIRTGRVVIAAGALVAGQVRDFTFAWDTDGLVRPNQTYAFAIGSANIPYMHTTVNLTSFSQTGGNVTVHNISGGGNAAFTVTILALARELG